MSRFRETATRQRGLGWLCDIALTAGIKATPDEIELDCAGNLGTGPWEDWDEFLFMLGQNDIQAIIEARALVGRPPFE